MGFRRQFCKATADILAMPRATVGRTVKEMVTILHGEIQATGDGGQALLALLAVGHSGRDSLSGSTTEEMLCEPSALQQGVCNARGAISGVCKPLL